MDRFELQDLASNALPDVAAFLNEWRGGEAVASIERRLQWLLIDNPAARRDSRIGYCVRDSEGAIRGLSLHFPVGYLSGEERLSGLCSGSFFVEPQARSLGFYLFKKFIRTHEASFYFASTCNAESAELWKVMGGCPVPNSETEYLLPLKLDGVIPAFVAARTSSAAATGMARLVGRGANPILRFLTHSSTNLAIEPCQDWEKLSYLFRRHRRPDHITTDRSPAVLEWRYGTRSPTHPCGVYLVRDKKGNEGWFALADLARSEGGLRESVLLDAIWPRETMEYKSIVQDALRIASATADAIYFRWQPGIDYREYSRFMIPRKLDAPRAFVSVPKGTPRFPLDSFDYDDSDYIAWRFNWSE